MPLSNVFLTFLVFNLSAITRALLTVQTEFHTDRYQLQWVVSAYALTFGIFLLLGGPGGDVLTYRRMLLFGCTFFAFFTLVCALAPTFVGLVIARAFQGVGNVSAILQGSSADEKHYQTGAAFTTSSAHVHITLNFPEPREKASALGFWGAAGFLGFIVGLIFGGVLANYLSWRWISWISLIISGILIPTAYLALPRRKASQNTPASAALERSQEKDARATPASQALITSFAIRLETLGLHLFFIGLLLLIFGLISASIDGWGPAQILLPQLSLSLFSLCIIRVYKVTESFSSSQHRLDRGPARARRSGNQKSVTTNIHELL